MTLSKLIVKKSIKITLENKSTNWEKVKKEIEETINLKVPLKTKQQLDTEAKNFITTIQNAVREHTINYERRAQEVSYPMEIRERVAKKRRARKKWQRTRYPADKTVLNRLMHELTEAIKKYKQDSISGST